VNYRIRAEANSVSRAIHSLPFLPGENLEQNRNKDIGFWEAFPFLSTTPDLSSMLCPWFCPWEKTLRPTPQGAALSATLATGWVHPPRPFPLPPRAERLGLGGGIFTEETTP